MPINWTILAQKHQTEGPSSETIQTFYKPQLSTDVDVFAMNKGSAARRALAFSVAAAQQNLPLRSRDGRTDRPGAPSRSRRVGARTIPTARQ